MKYRKDIIRGFYILSAKTKKQKFIFGHWAALNGYTDNSTIFGLDTGCVWGGELTIMQLDNLKITSTKKMNI